MEEYALNMTSVGLVEISNWEPFILISITLFSIIIFGLFLINKSVLTFFMRVKNLLVWTFGFFFYGVAGIVFISSFYYLILRSKEHIASGDPYLFRWLFYFLCFYVVLTVLGWVVKKFWVTLVHRYITVKKKMKAKEV